MAVILDSSDNLAENAAYDRVQKARDDAQLLINQKRHEFMQVSSHLNFSRYLVDLQLVHFLRWKIKMEKRFICRHKKRIV